MPVKSDNRNYPRCHCGKVFADVVSFMDHSFFCRVYKDQHPPMSKQKPIAPLPGQKTKICTKCHIEKPLTDFPNDKQKPDGVKEQCRECTNAYLRERYAKISRLIKK